MAKIWIFSLCALLLGGCNSATELTIDPNDEPASGLHTIAYLKSLSDKDVTTIHEEVVVEAVVTANDRFGEFIGQIIVEEPNGAIAIYLQGVENYRTYPIGTHLRIYCNGLTLRNYGGKIELTDQEDEYGRYGLTQAAQQRHLHPISYTESPLPTLVTIDELEANHIDRLVLLHDVSFTSSGRWCATDTATNQPIATQHTIEDEQGNTLTILCSKECLYANEPLPEGKGSLCGIVDYFGGEYALRISNYQVDFQ